VSERIRLLRVIARLNIGGPALHAVLLTERLDTSRYSSTLVTGSEEATEGNFLELQAKRLDRLEMIPALGRNIRAGQDAVALAQLVRLMRRVRPDIVHTHTAKAGTLGRIAALICRVPTVVHTYHGHVLHGYFSPSTTRFFVAIERWLARRTHRLLAVSERVRQELLAMGIGTPTRFETVPLGLDLDPFLRCESLRGQLRRELAVGPHTPIVGIVARLVPIKAHELFLAAAAEIHRTVPECRFAIVGDGERRRELEELTGRLGLEGRVHFLGWRGDLDRVYVDLDVVALTSRNEGLPVSLIEAMAAARPVVATSVGGVPDLVEDGISGRLAPPGDARALASAIVGLLADPDRARAMGGAGRKRVYPALNADRLLADIDDLYTRLRSEKSR